MTFKRKVLTIVILLIIGNIAVNVISVVPLLGMDFKPLSIRFVGETKDSSILSIKMLIRNNHWLPTRVPAINFKVLDSQTDGLIGIGYLSPITLDPGQLGISTVSLKLYKTEATKRLIRTYLASQQIDAKIRVEYPISLFGVIEAIRIPLDISLKDLIDLSPAGGGASISISSFFPSFEIKEIELTNETKSFCEAKVFVSGFVPTELLQVGTVEIRDVSLSLLTSLGRVLDITIPEYILDSASGNFSTSIHLRFIKGSALENFLNLAIKEGKVSGKLRGSLSLKIFGIEVENSEVKFDISQFSGFLSPVQSPGASSSIFDAIFKLLSKNLRISNLDISYLGEQIIGSEVRHSFDVAIELTNKLNWTIGFGPLYIDLLGENDESILNVRIDEKILVSPNENRSFRISADFIDNENLHAFLNRLLYNNEFSASLAGTADVYFAGVWIEKIDLSTFSTSQVSAPAVDMGEFMRQGFDLSSLMAGFNITDMKYNITATDKYLIVNSLVTLTYKRMPLAIYEIRGNIVYNSSTIGSVKIRNIDLNQESETGLVTCQPTIEIRIRKDSPDIGEFIKSFIKGTWTSDVMFIGSIDMKFLSRMFYSVPIRAGGGMISLSSGSVPVAGEASKFYKISGIKYAGKVVINNLEGYAIYVNATITNPFGAELDIGPGDLYVYPPNSIEPALEIVIPQSTRIPQFESRLIAVNVHIFKTESARQFLNDTLHGKAVNVIIRGNITACLGGVEINLEDFQTNFVVSLMDSLTLLGTKDITSTYGGGSVELLDVTEYPNRIEIRIKTVVDIPIPMVISLLIADVSLRKDCINPPVQVILEEPIRGPGNKDVILKIVLRNESSEFVDMIRSLVYGNVSELYVDATLALSLFDWDFGVITFKDFRIDMSSEETQQSVLSSIRLSNLFRIAGFKYAGETKVDGEDAFRFDVNVTFNNTMGITVEFWDASIYLSRDGQRLVKIMLKDRYILESKKVTLLSVSIYIFKGKEAMRNFLVDLACNGLINASIDGRVGIKIFGVEFPQITFIQRLLVNITDSVGVGGYQDIGGLGGLDLEDISIIYDNQSETLLEISLSARLDHLPVKVFQYEVNISLIGWSLPAITLSSNSTIDLYNTVNGKQIKAYIKIHKSNKEYTAEVLKRIIEGKLHSLVISGEVTAEIFGVNVTLPFKLSNITSIPNTQAIIEASALPNLAVSIDKFKYIGEEIINGIKAYHFNTSISFKNPYGVDAAVGPFSIEVIRDQLTVARVFISDALVRPKETSSLIVDMYVFSRNETYKFLKDLIENSIFNASIKGYGNITFYGIEVINVNITYNLAYRLSTELVGQQSLGSSPLPLGRLKINKLYIDTLMENATLAKILIKLNLTNEYMLPVTVWDLKAVLSKGGEKAIEAVFVDSLDLSKDFMNIVIEVLFYKKDVTAEIIGDLIEGDAIVDLNVSAYLKLLEWNFTVQISLKNVSYTSSSDSLSESIVPLNIENILALKRFEQTGPRTLLIEYVFNNFINVSLGIEYLSFKVIYRDYTVAEICSAGSYSVAPGQNVTMKIYLEIKDTPATQSFLEELLRQRCINVTISGVASISLFGLNISQISLASKIFADLSKQELPQATAAAPLINVTNAQLVSTNYDGQKFEVNVSISITEVPISVSIYNLNLTLENNFGSIGYVLVPGAEMTRGATSKVNATIVLLYRPNNLPLEKLIRDIVERKILCVNVSGKLDLMVFGYRINEIPIELSLNQSLESYNSANGSVVSPYTFIPLQDLFKLLGISQKTFGARQYYDLEVNASLKIPIAAPITIGDTKITISNSGYEALKIFINRPYTLLPDNWSNISVHLAIYDNPGAKDLLESIISGGVINVTIRGSTDLLFLGAEIDDLSFDYNLCQAMNLSQQINTGANTITPSLFPLYGIDQVKVWGEDEYTANVTVSLSINSTPVYIKVHEMNLDVSNDLGKIARLRGNNMVLSPIQPTSISLDITIFKGSPALRKFIEDYLAGNNAVVNVNGSIVVQLFDSSTQYLTLNLSLDLKGLTFNMSATNASAGIVPVDFKSLIAYKSLNYVGSFYDQQDQVKYYVLSAEVDFMNRFNISFAAYDINAKLIKDNTVVAKINVPKIEAALGNTTIVAYIMLADRPKTAEFLMNLINNYNIEINVDARVGRISLFGITVQNISLRQVFGWNVSEQLESSGVQETVLSMFNMTVGSITVLGEDYSTALLNINVTVSKSKIPVEVNNLSVDILYGGVKVANVFISYLELSLDKNTTFGVNVTIFKSNRIALQGFLQDLLVKKNVTMDVWGSVRIRLFDSNYLVLEINFKYNNTRYCVSDYYEALMQGEVDASALLNNVIRYSTENLSWKVIGEDKLSATIRLIEPVQSSLNIKILRMETILHMEPLNTYTAFGIQKIVGVADLRAGVPSNVTIEIVFLKNRYLQEFLDATLKGWSINVWASTKIDLEIFGVNISNLEALSAKFMFIITPDVIQTALNSMVKTYVNGINADAVALVPIGYGTYYTNDLYGGIENAANYAVPVWNNNPSNINLWNYNWILLNYHQAVGSLGFNVGLENFKALLVYNGRYHFGSKAGQQASGTLDDFFGEVYINNLTMEAGKDSYFDVQVRLWRVNRFRGFSNTTLKDWLWSMVKYHCYNFSIVNVTFDLKIWGCYIRDVKLSKLNFTGIYDTSSLANTIKFKGMSGLSPAIDFNQWVYVTVYFKIEVPMSPEWLVYYSMLIVWDDDPIFFEDNDTGDDPPSTGSWTSGSYKSSEAEELKALDKNSNPLAHDPAQYYISPQIQDAPSSLPSYSIWFGGGGTKDLSATIDIEWTDAFHDYIGNAYLDSQYDDEYLTIIGRPEKEDVYGLLSPWEGVEDGDAWSMVLMSFEVEIVMFWWVIYYYTPGFYLVSGDWNPNILAGKIVLLISTVQWTFHDYSNTRVIVLYKDSQGEWLIKPHPNASTVENATISGICFMDSYDGEPDALEPDGNGNY
ncbi:MAG: hypothetical protein NDP24_03430 [Crenarchaeota archaeon]|nr:hypothetical protein [Thermoproteota archaeon]